MIELDGSASATKKKSRRYKKMSVRKRIRALNTSRKRKLAKKSGKRLVYYKNFPFSDRPVTCVNFFKRFVEYYILNYFHTDNYIPDGFCPHIYVPANFVSDLEGSKPILHLLHQFAYTKKEKAMHDEAEEYYFSVTEEYMGLNRGKSTKVPFIIESLLYYYVIPIPDFFMYYVILIKCSEDPKKLQKIIDRKDKKVEKELLTCLSVRRSTQGKIVTILRKSGKKDFYSIYGEVKYETSEDYLYVRRRLLGRKYFSNVLMPYFQWQFGINFNQKDNVALRWWFQGQINNALTSWSCVFGTTPDTYSFRCILPWHAKCINDFTECYPQQ